MVDKDGCWQDALVASHAHVRVTGIWFFAVDGVLLSFVSCSTARAQTHE